MPVTALIAGLLLTTIFSQAQQPTGTRLTIEQAMSAAGRNLQFGINNQQITKGQVQVRTAGALPKTGLFAENEDLRPSDSKGILKVGLSQSIAWPGWYSAQKKLYKEQVNYYEVNTTVINADVKRNVRTGYYQLWYLQDKQQLYQRLDSIYRSLSTAAIIKVKAGDSPGLDSIAANVRLRELQALVQQTATDVEVQQRVLMQLLNTDSAYLPAAGALEKLPLVMNRPDSLHPVLALQQQQVNIANAGIAVTRNENRPEFSGRFFSQRLYGMSDPFTGFSVSVAFPLLGTGATRNKVKVAQAEVDLQKSNLIIRNNSCLPNGHRQRKRCKKMPPCFLFMKIRACDKLRRSLRQPPWPTGLERSDLQDYRNTCLRPSIFNATILKI